MASLTIKNIPDDLYEHLKRAAKAHHRSINSELIVCLEKVLLPSKAEPTDFIEAARALRTRVASRRFDLDEIDAAKREGRA